MREGKGDRKKRGDGVVVRLRREKRNDRKKAVAAVKLELGFWNEMSVLCFSLYTSFQFPVSTSCSPMVCVHREPLDL